MPLFQSINIDSQTKLMLWKITEGFEMLCNTLVLCENSQIRVANMKSESHQKGFLAVRMLLKENNYSDFDLYYDTNGKPHLHDKRNVSISHSHEFSAVAFSDKTIGLDLEILKEKTLKIAPRFMDVSHLDGLSKDKQLKKATVIWGIKESIFKIKNEEGISFKDHIFESNFSLDDKKCTVELRFNNSIEKFNIVFDFIENYVFVCAFPRK